MEVKADLPDDAVEISDMVLRSQLLDDSYLGSDGYISYEEMEQLTSLTLYSWGESIQNLSGLEYAENLKYLRIRNQSLLTNADVIGNLKKLEELELDYIPIASVKGINNLTNLKFLSLEYTNLENIDAVANLSNLWWLNLDGTNISDVSALSNMNNLRNLSFANCTNLKSIQPLYGLEKLQSLRLEGTQVPATEKLEMLCHNGLNLTKGDKISLPAIDDMITESDNFDYVLTDGEEYVQIGSDEYDSSKYSILAKEKGTVKLQLNLNDSKRDLLINIDGIPMDQEVGVDVGYEAENVADSNTGESVVLTSNGDLWQVYPETKKLKSNIKKYVGEWVYSGTDCVVSECSLDNDNVLWSGERKLAENVIDFSGHYALSENGVLTDIYNKESVQIENVCSWIETSESPEIWRDGSRATYVLKNDGSLWCRDEVEKEAKVNTFQKVADNVNEISSRGYVLKNGDFKSYAGEIILSGVKSVPDSIYDYYYGVDGHCYLSYNGEYIDIGIVQIMDQERWGSDGFYFLTADGVLYHHTEAGGSKLVSKNIVKIEKMYNEDYSTWLLCQDEAGAFYKVENDIIISEDPIVIKRIYGSYNNYDLVLEEGRDCIVEKNGIPLLDHVKDIWRISAYWEDIIYALRTDGTVWRLDGIPEKILDLNETSIKKGDLNGDTSVTIVDLMMCLHHVSSRSTLQGDSGLAADVNGDGKVTIVDLMRILHFVSGRTSEI